jgi:hypothetical protein
MLQEKGEFIPGEVREETSFGDVLFSIGKARWIIDSCYIEDPVDGDPFSAEKSKTGTLGKFQRLPQACVIFVIPGNGIFPQPGLNFLEKLG